MQLNGTLGFIGFGNMGEAIVSGLLETGTVMSRQIVATDLSQTRQAAAESLGITAAETVAELAAASSVIILAVKPQAMMEVLEELSPCVKSDHLIISIAAGITIQSMIDVLGTDTRAIRVMPNTPALVNLGAAGIAAAGNCTEADIQAAKTIFEAIGIAETFSEEQMHSVTALSGSGPAYFFYMVECMVKAAVAQGLDETQASRLAAQTLLGAGKLLVESGERAGVLRQKVTSKGGTTEAALAYMNDHGFEGIVGAALDRAAQRSRELGS